MIVSILRQLGAGSRPWRCAAADPGFGEASTVPASSAASPERWARVVFEEARAPIRTMLGRLAFGLGLRLGPLGSPGRDSRLADH